VLSRSAELPRGIIQIEFLVALRWRINWRLFPTADDSTGLTNAKPVYGKIYK